MYRTSRYFATFSSSQPRLTPPWPPENRKGRLVPFLLPFTHHRHYSPCHTINTTFPLPQQKYRARVTPNWFTHSHFTPLQSFHRRMRDKWQTSNKLIRDKFLSDKKVSDLEESLKIRNENFLGHEWTHATIMLIHLIRWLSWEILVPSKLSGYTNYLLNNPSFISHVSSFDSSFCLAEYVKGRKEGAEGIGTICISQYFWGCMYVKTYN